MLRPHGDQLHVRFQMLEAICLENNRVVVPEHVQIVFQIRKENLNIVVPSIVRDIPFASGQHLFLFFVAIKKEIAFFLIQNHMTAVKHLHIHIHIGVCSSRMTIICFNNRIHFGLTLCGIHIWSHRKHLEINCIHNTIALTLHRIVGINHIQASIPFGICPQIVKTAIIRHFIST